MPAAAVLVSLLALRRVVAEPLGVVRRTESTRRRRLWWRLLLPAVGLLALAPAAGQGADQISELRVAVGVIALLIGVAALLPWVVERVVGRLGAGKVAWQLAVRRLQLDPGGTGTRGQRHHGRRRGCDRAADGLQRHPGRVQEGHGRGSLPRHVLRRAQGRQRLRRDRRDAPRRRPGVRSSAGLSQYDVGRDPAVQEST